MHLHKSDGHAEHIVFGKHETATLMVRGTPPDWEAMIIHLGTSQLIDTPTTFMYNLCIRYQRLVSHNIKLGTAWAVSSNGDDHCCDTEHWRVS